MPAAASAEVSDFIGFLDASPTPYHAARVVAGRLARAGFSALDEGASWSLEPGARGYVLRGGSLIAFVLGTTPPWESGFVALGAHTDSPNLRLKPSPDLSSVGYRQAAIEVYGGVLLTTWLDRDLGLAGRVALAGGPHELVRLEGAPFRLPNLAIHLNREVNKDGLLVNPQTHLSPVWSLESSGGQGAVLELVAAALQGTPSAGATPADIVGFDLCLFDGQGASLGGAQGELISSARLDNLGSCHPITSALIDSGAAGPTTRLIALHDHEEVGSQSASGARSRLLEGVLERLVAGYSGAPVDAPIITKKGRLMPCPSCSGWKRTAWGGSCRR